jgi:uncharacterized protein YcnI
MAELPEATVSIDDAAGAFGGGTGYAVVIGCVEQNDDATPRVFASTKSLLTTHGYSPAVDYAAMHFEATKKPIIFVGIPTATAGAVGSNDGTGVTGTSVITISGTPLEETDAILTVTTGGTIGTNGIVFTLSLDGGRTEKSIRLGTASSYAIPYIGVTINFAAGTLIADDVYTFRTSAPMWDSAGLASARTALSEQLKLSRSWMVIGELANSTFAGYVVTQANAYETSHDRYVYARAAVKDRILGLKSKVAGQTLSFLAADETCTRSAGSWIADGFKVGDSVVVTGTASNDGTHIITTLTATVMTCSASTFVDEAAVASEDVDAEASQTMAAYVSAQDAAFASIDGEKRVDLSIGRARKLSPITGWLFRRPAAWALSIREYQHDLQIPTWRKADGPLSGWSLEDEDGNVVEFDERTDAGGLAGRFSCLRTYGNGPNGTYGALSLTRATEGSLLSRTHNMAVANLACTIAQAETENAIGQVLVLKDDGTAQEASLNVIEGRVNSALEIALLQNRSEGQRASKAVWTASRTDVLNVPGAELNGSLDLLLNGTLEKITTRVRIQTAG